LLRPTPGAIALEKYKQQLLSWLAPGGDFILLHFGRRGWRDWLPIGPNRFYADTLVQYFAPEFELLEDASTVRSDMPIFIGRSALVGRYWFCRHQ